MTGASLGRPLLCIRVPVHRLLLHRAISSTPSVAKPPSTNTRNPSSPDTDDQQRQQLQWQLEVKSTPNIANFLPDQRRSDISVSKHVRDVAKQYGWGFPWDTRRVSVKYPGGNLCKLTISVSRHHCLDTQEIPWLSREPHPYVQTILDRHIADEGKPLWFYPRVSNFNNATAPFVISTAKRRIKRCVRLALEECGYDIHGRGLGPVREGAEPRKLFGTIRVSVNEALTLCQMSDADILRYTRPMMDAAVLRLTLGADRSRLPRKKPRQQQGQQKTLRVPEKQGRYQESGAQKSRQQGYNKQDKNRSNEKDSDGFNQKRDSDGWKT